MVDGGEGQAGTADLQSSLAESREGLRRSDFMDQVQIDIEQRRRAWLLMDNVGVPQFFDDGARHGFHEIPAHTASPTCSVVAGVPAGFRSAVTRPLLSTASI